MIMIIEMMMMLMRRVVMVMMMMMVYVLSAGGTTVTRARGNVRRPAFLPLPLSLGISIHVFIFPRERESGSRASSCPAFRTTCTSRPDTRRVVVVVRGAVRHRAPAKTGPLSKAKACCLSLLVRRSLAGNFAVETARQPHPDSAANRARSESPLQTFTLFCRRLI